MGRKIVIPGGSGFLGTALSGFFREKGYEVVLLSRQAGLTQSGVRIAAWDGKNPGEWWKEIEDAEAIINLAGKSVNCVHTEANKKEIIDSRVNSVTAVAEAVRAAKNPPKVVVQAGSLAIFGDTKKLCDENAPHDGDFAAEVCELWENTFFGAAFPSTRQVMLRIGFVLGRGGGALMALQKLAKRYLGGATGDGSQFMSWIHMEDMNAMFLRAVEDGKIQGTFNATGPKAVTNREFMRALRKAVGRPWAPPVPAILVKLAAPIVMRTDASLALTGRNCVPKKFLDAGFRFKFPDLDGALKDLVD